METDVYISQQIFYASWIYLCIYKVVHVPTEWKIFWCMRVVSSRCHAWFMGSVVCAPPTHRYWASRLVRVCILLFDWDANTWWISIECIYIRLYYIPIPFCQDSAQRSQQFHVFISSLSHSVHSSRKLSIYSVNCYCERIRPNFFSLFVSLTHTLSLSPSLALSFYLEQHFSLYFVRTRANVFHIIFHCSLFCVRNKTLTVWRALCFYSFSLWLRTARTRYDSLSLHIAILFGFHIPFSHVRPIRCETFISIITYCCYYYFIFFFLLFDNAKHFLRTKYIFINCEKCEEM